MEMISYSMKELKSQGKGEKGEMAQASADAVQSHDCLVPGAEPAPTAMPLDPPG